MLKWLFAPIENEWTPEKIKAHDLWVEENVKGPDRRWRAALAVDAAWERNR